MRRGARGLGRRHAEGGGIAVGARDGHFDDRAPHHTTGHRRVHHAAGPVGPSATSGPTGSPVAPGSKPVVDATVDVGQLPFGIARDSTSVWVANQGSGTVSQIDPETHRVRARPGRESPTRSRSRPGWIPSG